MSYRCLIPEFTGVNSIQQKKKQEWTSNWDVGNQSGRNWSMAFALGSAAEAHFNNGDVDAEEYNDIVDGCCCLISFFRQHFQMMTLWRVCDVFGNLPEYCGGAEPFFFVLSCGDVFSPCFSFLLPLSPFSVSLSFKSGNSPEKKTTFYYQPTECLSSSSTGFATAILLPPSNSRLVSLSCVPCDVSVPVASVPASQNERLKQQRPLIERAALIIVFHLV